MATVPLKEPHPNAQAFIFHHGCYFVEYLDGEFSALMPHNNAVDYAKIFGGTVHRHSRAGRGWWSRVWDWVVERV